MSTDTITSGWQADPTGRHELRYHDGARWTEHVADRGMQDTDPYDAPVRQADAADAADAGWPTPPATRPDASSAAPESASTSPDPGTTWTADGDASSASASPSPAAWPTGSPAGTSGGGTPAGTGGGGAPDWTSVPPSGRSAGSGSSRSTGRRVGLVLLVLALMAVSAVAGFFVGLAVDVGGAIDEGLSAAGTAGRVGVDEARPSGVVLAGDAPRFDGDVDGPTAFTVEVAQAGPVAIEVDDADFDTYLTLLDESGQVVAEDDDSGTAGSLLSRIDVTLEPGTYILVLDSWSGGIDPGTAVVVTADVG